MSNIVIYKITSPTGKIYIGQTKYLSKRKSNYKNLKCKTQVKIYNSLLKYGFNNHKFEIIHELPIDSEQKIVDEYEIFYIKQYKDCGFTLLNISNGGNGIGKVSEETKIKISNTLKGQKLSTERRNKISKTLKNKVYSNDEINKFKKNVHSIESVRKAILTKTGKKYPKLNRPTREYLEELLTNNTLKDISKIYNISAQTIKNWINDYNITIIIEYNKNRKIKVSGINIIDNSIKQFNSITECANFFKVDSSTIKNKINNNITIQNFKLNYS